MLSIFTDSLPKPVLAAAAIWAGVSYFVTGPEAATRIARADYLPVCEAGFSKMVADAGVERLRTLPVPSLDPMQQLALSQVHRLQNNPFMDQLRGMSGGMGDIFGISEAADAAMAQMNHAQRTARETYDFARARIEQETADTIARADDVCSCVAAVAASETRTDWALYAGSFTLIEPAPVKNFTQKMDQAFGTGRCDAAKAGA